MANRRELRDRDLDAVGFVVTGLPTAFNPSDALPLSQAQTLDAAVASGASSALATEIANRSAGDTNAISVSETFATNADNALIALLRTPKGTEFWVYTLDYDGAGNDSTGAPGIATTASAALASALPLKTFEQLGKILPRVGNGATLVILAKPRASGANYRNIANSADADGSFLNGLAGWHVTIRGSLDFANDSNDKIRCGFLTASGTNAGGYTVVAAIRTITVTSTDHVSSAVINPTSSVAENVWVLANGGFGPDDVDTNLAMGGITNAGTRRILRVVGPTTIVTDGTVTTETFNSGSPTAAVQSSVWNFKCQLAGGGAPTLAAEGFSGITGLRIRFSATSTTTSLQNLCSGIVRNTSGMITPMVSLPALPGAGDPFVIETPGVGFGNLTFTAGFNRTFSLAGFSATNASTLIYQSPNSRISGCTFVASLACNDGDNHTCLASYLDEADNVITIGFGIRVGTTCSFSTSKFVTVSSSSWLGPVNQVLSIAGSVLQFTIGSGCVSTQGILASTHGPFESAIGAFGSTTSHRLRIYANNLGGGGAAIQLEGKGARIFGVDVSNCASAGLTKLNRNTGGNGKYYIDDIASTDGNNTSPTPLVYATVILTITDTKGSDGVTAYVGTGAGGAMTAIADRDILCDASLCGRFQDLLRQNFIAKGIRIYGGNPVSGAWDNDQLLGPAINLECGGDGGGDSSDPGNVFFNPGPFPPFRVWRQTGSLGPNGPCQGLLARAATEASCRSIMGVGSNYVYQHGDALSLIQAGPVKIEFIAGQLPSTAPTGAWAYLSELGGADTGKARIGPPPTGVACPLGPIQTIDFDTLLFAQVNLISHARTYVPLEGHAAESALVSIAGTVVDVALTASTVLGRNSSGDVVAVPFSTVAGAGSGVTSLTGDVTGTGPGATATTIANNAVSNAKLAQVPTGTLKGRTAAGTGNTSDLTFAAVKAALAILFTDITGTLQASQFPALSGDVTTTAGSLATTIQPNVVDNTKLADMATARFKGRATAGTGDPEDLNGTQATALLDVVATGTKGLAPASGGGTANFLRADGTWTAPPGTGGGAVTSLTGDVTGTGPGATATTIANDAVTNAKAANMPAHTFKANNTGSTADPLDITGTQATAELDVFDPTHKGLAPSSGGGTSNYLRADGTWATPAGTGGGGPLTGLSGDVTTTGGGVAPATISNDAVSFAKMQNLPTQTLVGRQTAATGDPESIGVTGGVEFDGSGNLRVGAFTGDVSKSAGSAGTVINPGVVTNAQLATVPTGTVKGRTIAGTGPPTDLTFAALKTAIAISFVDISGTLSAAQFPALTGDITTTAGSFVTTLAATGVTAGTFGDGSHSLTIQVDAKGRVLAISAPSISITAGAVSGLSTTQTGALTGDVTKPAGSGVATLANIPNDTPTAGDLLGTAIAAPAAPAAGKVRLYPDSTSLTWAAKNNAGVVTHMVRTHAAVASEWITSIDDDGTPHGAQPGFGDLSGALQAPQFPALTGQVVTGGGSFATQFAPTAGKTTLANTSPFTGSPVATSVADMRTMLGLNSPQHFDLILSFGIGDGNNSDSNTPQSFGPGNWPFFLLPNTKNSDIPINAYFAGNNDANLNVPAAINDWLVTGNFVHAQLFVNVRNVLNLSTSTIRFVISQNGLIDSSPCDVIITGVGSFDSSVSFAFSSGDRVGVRAQVLGGAVGVQLRAHVTVHLS